MSETQLRPVTMEDVPAMTAIMEALPEWFTAEAVEKVRAEDCRLPGLVAADEDGSVVGFVLWAQQPDAWEIAWIGVAREHHRRGIGRTLLAAMLDRARQAGIACLRVATVAPTVAYEPYARTRAFYERCGFRLESVRERGWPDGTDRGDYVLQLAL